MDVSTLCARPRVQAHAPRRRILHVLAGTGWGGAENMGLALHRLSLEQQQVSRLEVPAGRNLARWAHGARRRRRAYAPELVHAQLATPSLGGAAWWIAGSAPLVLTFQLLPEREPLARDYLWRVPAEWVLLALARRRAPCRLVAVSAPDRARLSRLLPGARVQLVPNRPQPSAAPSTAPPLPFPAGRTRLLSVGRLVEQKGFDRLLAALADERVRGLGWHWLIVGEGPARAALTRAIAHHRLGERVQLLGTRPAQGLFAQADLVLCPSRYEGAPLVPQEALAEGAPVLLSPIATHAALCADVPALLPAAERDWPARLAELLGAGDALPQLRAACAPLRAALDPDALWTDYARVYGELLAERDG